VDEERRCHVLVWLLVGLAIEAAVLLLLLATLT
jgi:hypothetical protein